MKTTWDEPKRQKTLVDRRIDFAEAERVFAGPTLDVEDTRENYGELRMRTFGLLEGRLALIVWTPRGDARHIISMRKCNEREIKTYLHRLGEV